MAEAAHWEPAGEGRAHCLLCPQSCVIPEGGHGICLGRVNRGGALQADNFGRCVSLAMDPIEKKPLYHVCPGREILSVACNGCNLRCDFCQNWTISQEPARTSPLPAFELVRIAVESGSFGIAYTYTEPLVWFEYILEAGALAHERGLKNVLVTNGVINERPLRELLPLVDAMNVDLKSMRPGFYREHCRVDGLESVLRTIRIAAEACHVEVTNLLIPGLNDSPDETRELARFVAGVDVRIPLHFSRYFPQHRMTVPATPLSTLTRAADIAAEKLYYVYLGNTGRQERSHTHCPVCGNLLVRRTGHQTSIVGLSGRNCRRCGRAADIVWCS
ncbi:MAG: AmmeMemoRadiSam system radical SAM enzyme [Candidatus Eisenbacteria bacterium]|nr:AmmeMemoRadiSam system radical SAM enzyme [Candidatus Eisenbacteria bacterium]